MDEKRLEERAIEAHTDAYDAFAELYESAFPPEERIDPAMLLEGAQLPTCSFTAYYDEGAFCGFTYEIGLERALYLLFLAVNDKIRSRGYGSRILEHVKDHAGNRPVLLEIEPVTDDAPNTEQRLKRLKFYERNGFSPTGYLIVEDGVTYTGLSTGGFTDMDAFKEDFARLAPGFANFEIMRA